jgi:hypothetical protein
MAIDPLRITDTKISKSMPMRRRTFVPFLGSLAVLSTGFSKAAPAAKNRQIGSAMSIKTKIQETNKAIGADSIDMGQAATDALLKQLASKFGLPIPAELRQFYINVGSARSDDLESNCIDIESAQQLLDALAQTQRWRRLNSTGLIDYIKYSWGNDRHEFDGYMSAESVAKINANYQAFGLWRGFEILEGAHYFYFDAQGKFGSVYYHQDAFDDLLTNHLDPMLAKSQADRTLEQCVDQALDVIKENMLTGSGRTE